jgi:tRNA G18 (ribose-2'-O)-methylase SpoU
MKYLLSNTASFADLEPYTNLKLSRTGSLFIAEGEKVVSRLLASDLEIVSLYLTKEHFDDKRTQIEAHDQAEIVQVILATKNDMECIVGFPLHQGIMAAARIPSEPDLDEVIARSGRPLLFIVLDTIADAENIGSIYRTALAIGASAIIINNKSVSPWIRRAVRVSMGAVFTIPTITVTDHIETIQLLTSRQISTFAAEVTPSARPVWDIDLTGDIAVLFGSEGYGIGRQLLEQCSGVIQIPMSNDVNSLNIGIAQGMVLYEILRQRRQLS